MIVFGMLFVGVLVVGAVVALILRRATLDEAKTEARLREPGAHKVTYAVPTGQDPAVLVAALSRAGFTSVGDLEHGAELLLVECEPEDRAQVRDVLEHVSRTGFDGAPMRVGHVTFEDER